MTKQQKANLALLSKYLKRRKLKAAFSMRDFCQLGNKFETECGSVGCAIGHGPYAGIPKTEKEKWGPYSERVFGLRYSNDYWKEASRPWMYLFAGFWSDFEPTARQAAARIDTFISNGYKVPKGWKAPWK